MECLVPVIDLDGTESPKDGRWVSAASEIGDACEAVGFFMVKNHGVPTELLSDATTKGRAFFRLSKSEKEIVLKPGHGRGYIPFEAERLGATVGDFGPGDLKESFNVTSDFEKNLWPERPDGFRATLEDLFARKRRLCEKLLKLCATAIGLPPGFFENLVDNPKAILRLSWYPATSEPPKVGQVRASAHTDYGTLTVLQPDPSVGGLQIMARNGAWVDVDSVPGACVINIGDVMERWMGGKWLSTPHRVIVPEGSGFQFADRLSMVFLHNPNPDATIEPIPPFKSAASLVQYPSIIAREYLQMKSERSRQLGEKQ